jgi:hypothetical protein
MNPGLAAWKVKPDDFPGKGTPAEKLAFLVNYAVLAPSKYNSQPWLFEICGGSLDLICDRNPAFQVTDPACRESIVSCGAALMNLRMAAEYFGYATIIEYFPWTGNDNLLARIRLNAARANGAEHNGFGWKAPERGRLPSANQPEYEPSQDELFLAMTRRSTVRHAFWPGTPPETVLVACCNAAARNGAWLQIIKDGPTQEAIADLVARGDRERLADTGYRRELAAWIHSARAGCKVGLQGSVYGLEGPLDLLTPGFSLLLQKVNLGRLIAARDRERARRAPVLFILGTAEDTPRAWLAAGQALESVLLLATAAGLRASCLSQPASVNHLRKELLQTIQGAGFPQIMVRVGYGDPTRHTPRRPAPEVSI